MKVYKYILSAVCLLLAAGLTSCKEDELTTQQNIDQALNSITTSWGMSKADVNKIMSGYTSVAQSSDDYLQFTTKDNSTTLIYQFSNDKLCASAAKIKTEDDADQSVSLNNYSYVGIVGTNEIYENTSANVFAAKYNTTATEGSSKVNYTVIGFTPLLAVTEKFNNKECVDLGLSERWATCNVGATKPEEYGDYYAWGETEVKDTYSWATYKYCDGTSSSVESIGDSINGTKYDVAKKMYGEGWNMPTSKQFNELRSNCDWVWTTENSVSGYKVFGKNGNYIFLPAAGFMKSTNYGQGTYGQYYSGTKSATTSKAYLLDFDNSSKSNTTNYKYIGLSIRPVCKL